MTAIAVHAPFEKRSGDKKEANLVVVIVGGRSGWWVGIVGRLPRCVAFHGGHVMDV